METHELRDLIAELAAAKNVLTTQDVDDCYRIAEVVQRRGRKKAQDSISGCPGRPTAFVYMRDGWSASVSSRTKVADDEHVVLRHGRYKHEFLLQRGLLKKHIGWEE